MPSDGWASSACLWEYWQSLWRSFVESSCTLGRHGWFQVRKDRSLNQWRAEPKHPGRTQLQPDPPCRVSDTTDNCPTPSHYHTPRLTWHRRSSTIGPMKRSASRSAQQSGIALIVCGCLLTVAYVFFTFNLLGLNGVYDYNGFSIAVGPVIIIFSDAQSQIVVFTLLAGLVAAGIVLVLRSKQKSHPSPPPPPPPAASAAPPLTIESLETRRFL